MFKTAILQKRNVNNFEALIKIDFSLTSAKKSQSSLLSYICKYEVNRDRRTRCTKSWSNLWKLWKLTHEQRETADGLSPICKGILAQSFICKKLSNQRHMANTVRNTRRRTLCWMRDKIKEFLVIKLIITLYLSLSFRNLSLQGKLYYLGKTLKSF